MQRNEEILIHLTLTKVFARQQTSLRLAAKILVSLCNIAFDFYYSSMSD